MILLILIVSPSLHFIPTLLLALDVVLLENVRLENSFLEKLMFAEQFFHDLVTEPKLVDTILEVYS